MVGSISWPVVTEVHLGPLMLRPHGLLIAGGFLAGVFLVRRSTRAAGISDDDLWSVATWGLVGGLIGMRVAWDLGHLGDMRSPLDLVAVWNGGMSLLGGLIGAIALGAIVARRRGLLPLPLLDLVAPGLALGIVIGRFSDLIIGDHLGTPTSLPWGFRYEGGMHPLDGVPAIGTVVHPVALYDMLLTTVLLVVLVRFARTSRAVGSVTAVFVIWYGLERITTDFLRTDPHRLIGLTGSQLVAIAAVTATTVTLAVRARRSDAGTHGPLHPVSKEVTA